MKDEDLLKDTEVIEVEGMRCRSCEELISETLAEKGVKSQAYHTQGIVNINFDSDEISIEQIKGLIRREGFDPK